MNLTGQNRARGIVFILIIMINVCVAVFVPTAIEAAKRSVMKSLNIKDLSKFTFGFSIPYRHMVNIKSMNDNIDYLYTRASLWMSIRRWEKEKKDYIYDEYILCAMSVDDFLLGSLSKKFLIRGRNFLPDELTEGKNVALVSKEVLNVEKSAIINICSRMNEALCSKFNIIGVHEHNKEMDCHIIIPETAMKSFDKNTYWYIKESNTYGSVIDTMLVEENVNEIIQYVRGAMGGGMLTYGIKAREYSGTLKALNQLSILSVVIYLIMLFTVSFVIFNYVLVSVSARKVEMGIYFVAGYTKWRLFLRFATQYFLLCASGAVAGLALALTLNHTVMKNLLEYEFDYFNASIEVFVVVSIISLLVCFFVCIYAASVVASSPPAELLRSD